MARSKFSKKPFNGFQGLTAGCSFSGESKSRCHEQLVAGLFEFIVARDRKEMLVSIRVHRKDIVVVGAQVGPFPIFDMSIAKRKNGAIVVTACRLFVW